MILLRALHAVLFNQQNSFLHISLLAEVDLIHLIPTLLVEFSLDLWPKRLVYGGKKVCWKEKFGFSLRKLIDRGESSIRKALCALCWEA